MGKIILMLQLGRRNHNMIENHRLEEAVKVGVNIPIDGYWGNVPSKICGAYAGDFDKKMLRKQLKESRIKLLKMNN